MKKTVLAVLFIAAAAPQVHGGGLGKVAKSAVESAQVKVRLRLAAKKCIEANIQAFKCQEQKTTEMYEAVSDYGQPISELGIGAARMGPLGFLFPAYALGEEIAGKDDSPKARAAREEIAEIREEFADVIEEKGFDKCRSACLVQCFVANSVEYDTELSQTRVTKFIANPSDEGPYTTAGRGIGVCRNFSTLGEEVGDDMGLDFERVATKGFAHNVIGYDDGGTRFLVEMQEDPIAAGACNRYKR